MTELFTRQGERHTGNFNVDSRGATSFVRARKCGRCGGAGRSEKWRYTGLTCYDCGGSGIHGTETVKLYTAEKLAKLNTTKAKADAKRAAIAKAKADALAAEAAARADTFRAANADLLRRAAAHMDNEFIADVITRANQRSEITEAQAAAVMTTIERIETRRAVAAASRHVGRVGERIECVVTVERASGFSRPKFNAPWVHETVHVITMRDENGNCIVSMSPSFYAEAGSSFTLRATVKDHSEYNGQQQTKVARAKAIQIKEAA